jgi:hypothetical protein
LAAVTSNSVQFLSAGSTATISARLGGMDITMLTVQSNKLDYTVFAHADVKGPKTSRAKSSQEPGRAHRPIVPCVSICAEPVWNPIRMWFSSRSAIASKGA